MEGVIFYIRTNIVKSFHLDELKIVFDWNSLYTYLPIIDFDKTYEFVFVFLRNIVEIKVSNRVVIAEKEAQVKVL